VTAALDTVLDRTLVGYGNVGYAMRRRAWRDDEPPAGALAGKVAVVTGAGSGIGTAACAGLARLGATVRMVVRDRARAARAREEVERAARGGVIAADECDVSSLAAVRADGEAFQGPLHVLVHNAGAMPPQREVTAEGNEVALATHVLGPHLLTAVLRRALAAGAPSRVIWVSSGGMYARGLELDDVQSERQEYGPATVYARTKRMEVVLAGQWAERLRDEGIVVHAMHPGWVRTPGLARSLPKFDAVARPLLRTPEQGADTIVWLAAAAAPARSSGGFWHDRRERPQHYLMRTRKTPAQTRALWEACGRLTGVEE
jgi:dehydrogenase/reductase SDR family protein 12